MKSIHLILMLSLITLLSGCSSLNGGNNFKNPCTISYDHSYYKCRTCRTRCERVCAACWNHNPACRACLACTPVEGIPGN